jgi:S-adenosylmethionine:tRNA ribosyltransferase-isomerase
MASRLSDFDYDLPRDLIAQQPVTPRDSSRLLVLDRVTGRPAHRRFRDLPEILRPTDLLVLNNTRVIPARLDARRPGGGKADVLLLDRVGPCTWEVLLKPSKRVPPGHVLSFPPTTLTAAVSAPDAEGKRRLTFALPGPGDPGPQVDRLIRTRGRVPLPPYIRRPDGDRPGDRDAYQTVYAAVEGAVAAPTAGLHFTGRLLAEIAARGVEVVHITCHVGRGTFAPIRVQEIARHRMHAERYAIPEETAAALRDALAARRRVVAVGTSAVRVLEHAVRRGPIEAHNGTADLYIYPPFSFRVVGALVTNLHVPRSTPLLLAAAFAGREHLLAAYREAVGEGYRFYSYGDAMLIH